LKTTGIRGIKEEVEGSSLVREKKKSHGVMKEGRRIAGGGKRKRNRRLKKGQPFSTMVGRRLGLRQETEIPQKGKKSAELFNRREANLKE